MGLAEYKKMRRFNKTPEPEGEVKNAKSKRLEFVIQKHHASRLHYDFRLELNGVLKSWAVPKGPSLNPADRRLAMQVEDHPYEYRKFEGVIPAGNYGAGKVIIWDRGWYELHREEDSWPPTLQEGLKKGELKFILHGEKLNGSFALIKTPRMGDNAWLLIKHKDEYATMEDITKQNLSVVSSKDVEDINKGGVDFAGVSKSSMPKAVKPMLATLTDGAFDHKDWIFEIKWDGYRAIGSWDGKQADLYSRNGNDFKKKYPAVVEALRNLGRKVVLDGEVVAVNEQGRSNFSWLQNWGSDHQGELAYYVFDILWCDNYDLTNLSLLERKEILKQIMPANSLIRYSDHVSEKGTSFYNSAAKQKLEGIMAKNGQSKYIPGRRSEAWLKIKTHMRQEVVIGGFTEPRGSRKHIGALLVGLYDNGRFTYVGHVGGGIPTEQLPTLRKQLEKLEIKDSPFSEKVKPNSEVYWVEPKLVCEVSFGEWTADNRMRQPIFEGMRIDKDPGDIVREKPKETAKPSPKTALVKIAPKSQKLNLTHLEKVFFPDTRYTKGDLIDYYKGISKYMLPYLKDRPHNLLRQPNGINGESFFQKDVDHTPPDWVKTAAIYSESNQKKINYMVVDSLESLLYMVQLGCVEINPWNSRVNSLDKPDWLVIDLDPEDINFKEVVKVALVVKNLCDELKIPSYPKTSGKTGIHIFMPLAAKYTYEQCKQFAQLLANIIHERIPETTSVERLPKKRQKKIYIDFLQNREGQTLAAPYSVRPTPVASVSTPLHWDEVNDKLDPANFTIKNTVKRIKKEGDLWRPVVGKGIDIKKILPRLT
jgi:bifunctional non-homologous end joining protein LigD